VKTVAVDSGTVPVQRRALSLDALRGLAILMMVFANAMPDGLPSWMYHAQLPPPTHAFIPTLPGISWVDLVFPFFLFSMGAAIPLAISRRIEMGQSMWGAVKSVLTRGALLVCFAMYLMQIHPYVLSNDPKWQTWLLGLLGFGLLFPVLARLPKQWTKPKKYAVRAIGWCGAILFMVLVKFPDSSGFSLYRSDDIIMILANVAVFDGLIWLMTRDNWFLRLGIMGILIAFRLSSGGPVWSPDLSYNSPIFMPVSLSATPAGWVHSLWLISPLPWLFQMRFLQYLLIIIPGTIVGDMISKWMKNSGEDPASDHGTWSRGRKFFIPILMIIVNIVVVVGLKEQWSLWTSALTIGLCMIGWQLVDNPEGSTEHLLNSFFKWGTYWLILGLLIEPYESGIKKDPATVSYYFVTAGLAIFMLIALTVLIDMLDYKKPMKFLVNCGQNPMIAYAGADNLIPPILALSGLGIVLRYLTPTPWLGVIGDGIVTYLIALSTIVFTRKKIFLRT